MDVSSFGKGGLHVEDLNDYSFGVSRVSDEDWSVPYKQSKDVTIGNQGHSLSCVGQTVAKMRELLYGTPRSRALS